MKRLLATSAVALALIQPLSACVPALIAGGAAGGYYVGQDERPLDVMTEDAGITASVKGRLIREKDLSAFDINVDTYEGVVTLYGNVSNQNTADRAEKIARTTDGVKHVVSKLTVIDTLRTQDEDAVERPEVDLPDELPEASGNGAYPID